MASSWRSHMLPELRAIVYAHLDPRSLAAVACTEMATAVETYQLRLRCPVLPYRGPFIEARGFRAFAHGERHVGWFRLCCLAKPGVIAASVEEAYQKGEMGTAYLDWLAATFVEHAATMDWDDTIMMRLRDRALPDLKHTYEKRVVTFLLERLRVPATFRAFAKAQKWKDAQTTFWLPILAHLRAHPADQ